MPKQVNLAPGDEELTPGIYCCNDCDANAVIARPERKGSRVFEPLCQKHADSRLDKSPAKG